MNYRLSAEAQRDIDAITCYIAERNPAAAVGFALRLTERLSLIGSMPEIGAHRNDIAAGLRSYTHGNYLILYRIESRTAVVARVVHGARDVSRLIEDDE